MTHNMLTMTEVDLPEAVDRIVGACFMCDADIYESQVDDCGLNTCYQHVGL